MSSVALANVLSISGIIFLSFMGIIYLSPPIKHHVVQRTPPGIIALTYTILTLWSIIIGIKLITSESFIQIVRELVNILFLEGKRGPQENIMVLSIFFSLYFILGNLIRSYFNLHRIEEPTHQGDHFTSYISNLRGRNRWFEFILRTVIFILILSIEYLVVKMSPHADTKGQIYHYANDFQGAYYMLWNVAVLLYLSLLVWDVLLLLLRDSNVDGQVNTVLLWQALPVHVCGILTALCLSIAQNCSSCCVLLINFAFLISVIGLVWLFSSLRKDINYFRQVFR